jgi:hypothetical protein
MTEMMRLFTARDAEGEGAFHQMFEVQNRDVEEFFFMKDVKEISTGTNLSTVHASRATII